MFQKIAAAEDITTAVFQCLCSSHQISCKSSGQVWSTAMRSSVFEHIGTGKRLAATPEYCVQNEAAMPQRAAVL